METLKQLFFFLLRFQLRIPTFGIFVNINPEMAKTSGSAQGLSHGAGSERGMRIILISGVDYLPPLWAAQGSAAVMLIKPKGSDCPQK